jgi:hypothetical protein
VQNIYRRTSVEQPATVGKRYEIRATVSRGLLREEGAEEAGDAELLGIGSSPSLMRIVRLERRMGWVLIAMMATAVGFSWAADIVHGDVKALLRAALGLGLIAVLAAALWYGRRLIAAFAAMAAGFAPVKPGLTGIVFVCLAYGGILSLRDTRARRTATMARTRRLPKDAKARSVKAAAVVANAARGPTANRRYTPPKAKPPRRDS